MYLQVAHFYNTIDSQMIPCQQAMMLNSALAFEKLIKNPKAGENINCKYNWRFQSVYCKNKICIFCINYNNSSTMKMPLMAYMYVTLLSKYHYNHILVGNAAGKLIS